MTARADDDHDGAPDDLPARIGRWLPAARWFPGKDRGPDSVTVIDRIEIPATGGLAVALVASAGAVLVVPVDPRTGLDAAVDPALVAALTGLAVDGGSVTGLHGVLVGHPVGASGAGAAAGTSALATGKVSVRALGGDASNTSLVIARLGGADGAVVLKLLRQARPGIHPEVEFGRFFATATDWRETPGLRGWIEYRPTEPHGLPAAVATLHTFEPGCRSAWEVLVGWLAEGGLEGANRERILALVRRLGAVTARMHRALASRGDLPDFAPEPATAAGRRALGHRLATHARSVLTAAVSARAPTPALADRLALLGGLAPHIRASLETLADAGTTAADIRVHGDYHLGQVLVDERGERVMPIDFEGEPTRPIEERRVKTSAAKDVAGMLRSFDYALSHGADREGESRGDRAVLEQAFLGAYRQGAAGEPWWPAEADEERRLVGAFTLDKAVYELAYELANRPDWVGVPLGALEELAGRR